MAEVKSKVPRGFTRFYILHLMKEKPMRGKEIITAAEKRSEGTWIPSPGLIYPLLGRLVKGNLITEVEDGRFSITPKGEAALKQHTLIQEQLERQIRLVRRLGLSMFTAGKYLAEEALDRVFSVTTKMHEMIAKSSFDIQKSLYKKYKSFLESELSRLEEELQSKLQKENTLDQSQPRS